MRVIPWPLLRFGRKDEDAEPILAPSRRELRRRVVDLERQSAERDRAQIQRVAACERANRLRVGFLEARIEDLEEQIRELNPGLPGRRLPFTDDAG